MYAFVNISNFPLWKWDEAQKDEAMRLVREENDISKQVPVSFVEIPFPKVAASWSEEQVKDAAAIFVEQFNLHLAYARKKEAGKETDPIKVVCLLHGEASFQYRTIQLLKEQGISCVVAATEQVITSSSHGSKTTTSRFVRFRRYL